MSEPVGIKSPYWQIPLTQVVRMMDDLFDPEQYQTVIHYRDALIDSARKNPEQFRVYVDVLVARTILARQVIEDSLKPIDANQSENDAK